MKEEIGVLATETSNDLNISFADAGEYTVTNSATQISHSVQFYEPRWVCEKHGETDKTISFIYENGAWRATYCLECLVEKLGLPNIEDTRK